jgi:glycosyltransferase involved in cell wall biosynthesis
LDAGFDSSEAPWQYVVCSKPPNETRILFLIPGDPERLTGGSLYNRKLYQELSERGFHIELVNIPDLTYFAALAAGLLVAPVLLIRFGTRRYDAVVVDGWAHPAALLFNLARRLTCRTPLVTIVHQVRWHTIEPPVASIARFVEQLALSSADLIIAVSAFIGEEVEQLIGGNTEIAISPPGSDLHRDAAQTERNSVNRQLQLLFVGNCTPLKGLDHLITALSLLRDLDLRLDIVGETALEPTYYNALVRKVKALGLDGRITFYGTVASKHLGPFYSRADIFTFPSLYEGFGIVLAEAMQAGLPIVATQTGAVHEILREGENALIVPPADPAALADAIRTLAMDPALRNEFGRRSLDLAGSLPTWKRTCESICDRIEIMVRTTRGMKQKPTTIPTR